MPLKLTKTKMILKTKKNTERDLTVNGVRVRRTTTDLVVVDRS